MRVVMFYHSLRSDWNHGNAHFLRGVATELVARGHVVTVYEPEDGWSAANLAADQGKTALDDFRRVYPSLQYRTYEMQSLDLEAALDGASLVLAHEWNAHELIARLGEYRARRRDYVLLFHDTHHRSVTDPASMSRYDLRDYDGVLAYGASVREVYLRHGWASRVFVWHEAADTRVFRPLDYVTREGDVVWIGNWGDEERSAELHEFLIEPVKALGLKARVYGVRYPREARGTLRDAGAEYRGWLPNYEVPRAFAAFAATVHVPRRPYAEALRGVPTIRVFEALACGVPLVSAPWEDAEHLFSPDADYLVAENGAAMRRHLADILNDAEHARALREQGLRTVRARHTCAHRVDELLDVAAQIRGTRPDTSQAVSSEDPTPMSILS